jgi:transposase
MRLDEQISLRFLQLAPTFTERSIHLFAAVEANAVGHGGVSRLSRITGLSRPTIEKGKREIAAGHPLDNARIRSPGVGRKKTIDKDATLLADLEGLVEPRARGDPESPLRWTCKSTRGLAAELKRQGHAVSQRLVWTLLHRLRYSLQGNEKAAEGDNRRPDRNARFERINAEVSQALAEEQPVISVYTQKKELAGNHKNNGRQRLAEDSAPRANGHDFPGPEVPRAFPYGIYDLAKNEGHAAAGGAHDPGAFAAASIRGW